MKSLRTLLCILPMLIYAALYGQSWPQNGVEFTHNESTWAYWVPEDAPAGETLRVIVRMRGAGAGIDRHSEIMDALTERGVHAVVVTNADSYREVLAAVLVDQLRAEPHGLDVYDDIVLTGFSRGGQMTNRIMQQMPDRLFMAAPQNAGSVTTPSGRLVQNIDSNQGGWTDIEMGPSAPGSTGWTGSATTVGLGEPAIPAARDVPILNIMGINDNPRYTSTYFMNMEMQHLFKHPHYETFWAPGGHSTQHVAQLAIIDMMLRLEAHPDNPPPTAEIDGPRVIVVNPGDSHTLTATATHAEHDDADLQLFWHQVSVESHDFRSTDQHSYAARYIDGFDGWIPIHNNAAIRPSREPGGSMGPGQALSRTDSFSFTARSVDEDTPILIEFRATDPLGFTQTDSVLVVLNGPPRILEGPVDHRSILRDTPALLRYRALDIDSASLLWSVETGPAHGTLDFIESSGEFADLVYQPAEGYLGEDTFVLRATDGLGLHADLTIELTVTESSIVIPADMNAVQQRSTDQAGSLINGATMKLKTGPYPDWMDFRSAYIRFPLEAVAGEPVSAEAHVHVNTRNRDTGTDTITVYRMPADPWDARDGLASTWGIVQPLSGESDIAGTFSVDSPGPYSVDVTAAVKAAVAAGERSLTLMLRSDSNDGPSYASRHWPEPNLRPRLKVVSSGPAVPPSGRFPAWIDGFPQVPPDQRGPLDMPAGDGVANMVKFAFGLAADAFFDGTQAGIDRPGLPWIDVGGEGPTTNERHLRYQRDPAIVGEIEYVPEWSEDLRNWQSGPFDHTVVPNADGTEHVKARLDLESPPEDLFMRVRLDYGEDTSAP
ncbi:MAG: DNRLRE domain-containing protein [Opitutales bacterium]|nr:DNRLRE domain-containing protein [Opitutales bacterium]